MFVTVNGNKGPYVDRAVPVLGGLSLAASLFGPVIESEAFPYTLINPANYICIC